MGKVSGKTVVVGGGRHWEAKDLPAIWETLDAVNKELGPIARLIHGDCPGFDLIARDWARDRGIEDVAYPARWEREGKAAGPRRNARMIDNESPEFVIAGPGGAGTRDLAEKTLARKLTLVELAIVKGSK